MRFLPALLLIVVPLLAQEPSDEERREAEIAAELQKRVAEEHRVAAERVKRLLGDLQSRDEAERARAIEQLKQVDMKLEELLPLIEEVLARTERMRGALAGFQVEPRTLVLRGLGGSEGSEAISGTADGTEYSLKSLGGGKYQLTATKRDDDGRMMEQIEDQGTMAELQGKHAFLQAGLAVEWKVPATWDYFVSNGQATAAKRFRAPVADVGHGVWDGGGRVGVTVCPPSEDLRFHLQLPEGAGFIVQYVVPGSRAEQIGIRRMDILLKLDGELIDSPIQLKKLHEKTGVLEILRRSEARKIDLSTFPAWTPPEAPAPTAVDTPTAPEGAR